MNNNKQKPGNPVDALKRMIALAAAQLYIITKNTTENIVRRIRFSISFRLTLVYVRKLMTSLLLSTLLINAAFGFITLGTAWNQLTRAGNSFTSLFEKSGGKAVKDFKNIIEYNELICLVMDSEGKNIHIIGDAFQEDYTAFRYLPVKKHGDNIYLVFRDEKVYEGTEYQVIMYKNIDQSILLIIRFLSFTMVAHIAVIFVTVVHGAKTSSRVIKPIKDITETAKRISGNNLSLRINLEGVQDELKELAETINSMMDRIENSYNQQQQFVSDVSHELRTPIAVLQGYANLLDRWGKNDPQVLQESIEAIKNETENMKELVEKLLFLARHDAKTLVLQKETFDLSQLLTELVRETRLIDNNNHKIMCSLQENLTLYGDRNRIKQAIRIFIDNAVKYTPKDGEIIIKASMVESKVIVSVKDTGIGIAKEDLEHVFDRFYRSDKSRTKEKGGHGLGLSIAKIIILGHKGKIKIRSKVGEGTEIQLTFNKKQE
ncbi:MAG: HAMP domain-containing protein [Clostridiaceae bacterium]|nr:HAMP domain-containing protein [Clostridiaceae bacterium]